MIANKKFRNLYRMPIIVVDTTNTDARIGVRRHSDELAKNNKSLRRHAA